MPLGWAAHVGQWINDHVLTPFQIGTTAKQVTEEEIGCYGVLAYLIYKVSHLLVDALPLCKPRWLVGRFARALALVSVLLASAWLLTCFYVGTLIPILDLQVSYGGLLLAPAVAWIALGYVMLAERVRARRAELEAQSEVEDD
jgi:hypothetical protein